MHSLSYKTLFIILLFLLIPIVFLLRSNLKTTKVLADWWNDSWSYRIPININNTGVGQTNVYVTLTVGTSDTSRFQADGGDIRFTYQNNLLSYFIVNSTTIHVNFPTLPVGNSTIYMYYGNPSAPNGFSAADFSTAASNTTPTPSAEEVGGGPVAYWKFDEGVGTSIYDSSSNQNNALLSSGTWLSEDQCVTGKCLSFNGVSGSINGGTSPSLDITDQMTQEMWVYWYSHKNYGSFFGKPVTGSALSTNYMWYGYDNKITFFIGDGVGSNSASVTVASGYIDINKWHHVVSRVTSTNLEIWIDGILRGQGSRTRNPKTNTNAIEVVDSSAVPNAKFDDVKIYNYARTPTQIKSDYTNTNSKTSFGGSSSGKSLSDGLVGYWKFDEGVGTTTADSSGNSNIATFATGSSAPDWAGGKFGIGISLDGQNDYIFTGSTLVYSTSPRTFTAWVKNVGTTGRHEILNAFGNFLNIQGNQVCLYINGANSSYLCSGTTLPSNNSWNFITASYDSNNTERIYINNNLAITQTVGVATTGSSTTTYIGICNYCGMTSSMNGQLDEVRIYNRDLSTAEVTALYNYVPSPVAYYNFEEGSGTIAKDISGNNNSGTLGTGSSAPTWSPGKFGKAMSFDGNDFVSISPTTLNKNSELTMSTWIKTSSNNTQTFLGYGIVNDWINLRTSNYVLQVWDDIDDTNVTLNGPTLSANTWYYATLVLTSNGNKKLYLNGVLSATGVSTTTVATNIGTDTLYIGQRNQTGTAESFTGLVDEVKIYNYARTQKQIMQDMQGDSSSSVATSHLGEPIIYYKLDEGNGTLINNYGTAGTTYHADLATGDSSPSWTTGKFNKGLFFDGNNDYAPLNSFYFPNNNNFTLTSWFNLTTGSTTGYYFPIFGNNQLDGLLCYQPSSKTFKQLRQFTGGNTNINWTTPYQYADSLWHYAAVAVDQGTTSASLYIDGKFISTQSIGGTEGYNHSNGAFRKIGQNLSVSWNGSLDELKVYNYTLSADEIKIDYNQGATTVVGATSQSIGGTVSNLNYCVPGDTTACSPPIAEWNFEEGTGTTAFDTSGNGNNGGISGATWTTGKFGKALQFDEASYQYLSSSTGPNQNFNSAFTIGAWVKKISNSGSYDWIVNKGLSSTTTDFGLTFTTNDTILRLFKDGGAVYADSGTLPNVHDNKWHFVSSTFDSPSSSVKFYFDGQIISTGSTASFNFTTFNTNATGYLIGAWNSPLNHYFSGSIDQVRLYNYARTPAQIAWDYNQGAPVGWWKFDECQGSVANDASGLGHPGSISIGTSGTQNILGTCAVGTSAAWTNGATGKINSSLSFDGTDDLVSIPDNNTLRFANSDLTISAWVYPKALANQTFVTKGTGTFRTGYKLIATSTQFGFMFSDTATQNDQVLWAYNYGTNVWYHLVMTINKTTNLLTAYVNGKQVGTFDITGIASDNTGANSLLIGRDNAYYANANIDEVRAYNYSLTSEQVKQLYNGGAINFR